MREARLALQENLSYRDYLKKLLKKENETSSGATKKNFATEIPMAVSTFSMVLNGKRNFTRSQSLGAARAMKLGYIQTKIWDAWVSLEQCSDPLEKAFYKKTLEELLKQDPIPSIRSNHSGLKQKWYVPALLGYILDFTENKEYSSPKDVLTQSQLLELSQKYNTTPEEISECTEELFKSGILELKGEAPNVQIRIDQFGKVGSQKNLVKKMTQEAILRMEQQFGEDCSFFSADVLTITQESLEQVRREYKDLLLKYAQKNTDDGLSKKQVQFCIQAFSL